MEGVLGETNFCWVGGKYDVVGEVDGAKRCRSVNESIIVLALARPSATQHPTLIHPSIPYPLSAYASPLPQTEYFRHVPSSVRLQDLPFGVGRHPVSQA